MKTNAHDPISHPFMGLTKREEFAKAAMQALIPGQMSVSVPVDEVLDVPKNTARWAVSFADALIDELNRKEKV